MRIPNKSSINNPFVNKPSENNKIRIEEAGEKEHKIKSMNSTENDQNNLFSMVQNNPYSELS